MTFNNRSAIVTGAAKGIGRATAVQLAAAGVRVAVLDLAQDAADAVAEDIRAAGGTALALATDITKNDAVTSAVNTVVDKFGSIDILINCAGAGWHKQAPFSDMPADSWKWIIDLNVNATFFVTHTVIQYMLRQNYGRIINISSISGKTGIPNLAAYSASKGAIDSFTRALAMETGTHGITVNSVSPGLVTDADTAPPSDGTFIGRMAVPDDIAPLITFLASEEAAYITGADHIADGGRSLGPRGV